MARKSNGDYNLDDFDFDDFDLDGFGDFDSMNKPKKPREAITSMAGNFITGMGQGLLKPENQRKIISKGLPQGYTMAFDNVQEGVQSVSEVMDEVSKGMGDLVKSTKKTVDGFVPVMEKVLPEKILAGIKKWSQQENPFAGRTGPTQDDIIASNLADLTEAMKNFSGGQSNDRSKQKKSLQESDAVNLSTTAVTNKLLENQTEQILAVRKLMGRSVAATEQVTFKFQQKSLELMYQQLFTTRKLLDTTEQSLSLQRDAFEKITHNTGLPDLVKVKNSELGGQFLKQHAFESLYNSSKPAMARVGRRIVQQARGNIKGFFGDMNGQISDVNSLFDMMGDGDIIDPKDMLASLMGDMAAGFGSKYLGKGLKKLTGGNETLEKNSIALQNFFSEKNSYLKNMMNSNDPLDSNFIIEFIRDKLGGDSLFDEKSNIVRSAFKESELDEPTTLRWRSVRSVEEIIPGWLRMMHNELQMMRTGDHSLKPMSFDSRSGTFKSKDDMKAKLKDELLNRNDMESHGENAANVLKVIDPDNKLSVGARNKLLDHIIKLRNDPDKVLNLKDIASDNTNIGMSYDEVEELHALVNEFEDGSWIGLDRNGIGAIKDDFNSSREYQEYRMKINKAMSRLKAGQRDNREAIADQVKGGNLDILRELGIVKVDDSGDVNQNDQMLDQLIRSGAQKYLAHGGWTGPGGKHEGAGLVHKDEYVVQKKVTSQPGAKRFLDMFNAKGMDALRGYDVGGAVGLERGYDTVNETKSKGIGDAILDAIRSNNPTDLFNETNSRLDALVLLNQQIAEKGYGVGGLPNISGLKRATGWIKGLGIKTFKWSGKATGAAWNTSKAVGGVATDFVLGNAKKLKLDLSDMSDAVIDVYTKYSDKPIFTRKGFLNGEYFDKDTRKVLKSLKDIKGDVVDDSGNIIATTQDYADGLYTSTGRNLKSVFSWFGGLVSKYGPSAIKSTIAGWKKQLNVVRYAKGILSRAWNIMDDVYVKGEDSPRLLARILNTHKYFRKHDNEPIKSYKDLTGEVADVDGNVVLTVADMQKGLVDGKGNPIGTRLERMLNSVKKVFTGAKKVISGVKDFGAKMIGAGWDASTAVLGGIRDMFFGGGISVMGKGAKNVLFEIRDILDKRLAPAPAGSVFGDTDGDGDRDNSWQDIVARRKEKDAEKDDKVDGEKPEKKKSSWGLMSILTGIGSMVSGVYATLKSGIGGMISWLRRIAMAKTLTQGASAAGDLLDAGGRRGRGGGRGGRLGRMGKALMRGPAWAKLAGGAALAGGTYYAMKDDEVAQPQTDANGQPLNNQENPGFMKSMWNGMTDGGTADGVASLGASTALSTAGFAAATGAVGGLLGGGGMAMGALAALGGPITLGIIGVGAAVWAGAKLYKKFANGGSSLNSFRMMQYGFNPSENKDQVARIAALEDLLSSHTSVSKDGQIKIDNSVSYKQMAAIFDVKDGEHLATLDNWFKLRFKPVYAKWVQAYQTETGKTNLSGVDGLDKLKRVKILAAVHTANMSEYTVTVSPFKTPASTTVNGSNVHEAFKSLEKMYSSAAKKVGANASATTGEGEGIMSKIYNAGKTALSLTPIGLAARAGSVAWNGIKAAGSWIGDTASTAGSAIANGASAVGSAIGGGWNALMGGLKTVGRGIAGAANTVGGVFSDAMSDTTGIFEGTGGSIGNIPKAKGKGWANVKDTILAAAKMVGVDASLMASVAAIESGFDPNAKAGASSAAGLYQFIGSTWKSMVNRHGKTYGIPANTSPLDARANAVLGAQYIKENADIVRKIKGSVSPVDVYMAHFLGGGGVRTFLTAMKRNPNAIAAQILPQAAGSNKDIFYDGGRARTLAEVYQLMANKVSTKAGQHGVDLKSLAKGGSGAIPAAAGTNAASKTPPPGIAKPGAKAPPIGIAKPSLITGAAATQSQADNIMKNAKASVANKAAGGSASSAGDAAGAVKAGAEDKLGRLLKQATPELVNEGRKYTSLNGDVDLKGMNSKFMTLFYAMIGDGIKKGAIKRVDVNSAYRSPAKQEQLYAQYLRNGKPLAAKPGKSNHEKGLALDINSAQANALAGAGLLAHWGFFRPLLNHKSHPEPWHVEHAYFTSGAATGKATQTGAGAQAGTPVAAAQAVKYDRNKNGGSIIGIITPGDPNPRAVATPTDTKVTDAAPAAENKATAIISPNSIATGNSTASVSKPLSVPDTSSKTGQGLTERKKTQAELDKEILDKQAIAVQETKQRRMQADETANVASNRYMEQSVMHQASMDHTLKQLLKETQAMTQSIGGLAKGLVATASANAKAPTQAPMQAGSSSVGFSSRDPISLDV